MKSMDSLAAAPLDFEAVPIDGFKSLARATPRLDRLTADDLEQLNAIVKWNCFTVDSEGRRIGDRARPGKRDLPQEIPSRTIVLLDDLLGLSDKHVLEVGCFEGVHTIGLCDRAREVTAIDSRMENVVKAILRCYLYGCSADIRRCNVEVEDELQALPEVDVVHHVGVLYHLVDPVAHLARLSRKIRSAILLDTHVAAPEQATEVLESGGQQYPCSRHKEGGVKEVFSGMFDHANWLTVDTLTLLLRRLGFKQVDVLEHRSERNGPRVAILAKR